MEQLKRIFNTTLLTELVGDGDNFFYHTRVPNGTFYAGIKSSLVEA